MSSKNLPPAPTGISAASSMHDVYPDLHHKMSKKIAQLTKVIYHLNTKNEDHTLEVEAMRSQHQQEIQQLISDTTTRISKMKEMMELKQATMNQDQNNEKLIRKHEVEKKQYQQDFQAFKLKIQERDQKLSNEFQLKYDAIKNDMDKVTFKLQEKLQHFESTNHDLRLALDETRLANGSTIDDIRRKHEHEVKCLKDQLQHDLHTQLEEVRHEVSTHLKRQYEKELGQVRASLTGDKQEGLMSLKRDYDEKIQLQRDEYQLKLDKSYNDWKCIQDELHLQQSKMIQLQDDHQRVIQDVHASYTIQLNDKEVQLQHMIQEVIIKKNDLLSSLSKIEERQEEIQRLNKLLSEKNIMLVQHEEQIKKLVDDIKVLKDSLLSMNQHDVDKDQHYQHLLAEKNVEIQQHMNNINMLKQDIDKLHVKKQESDKNMILVEDEYKRVVGVLEEEKLMLQQRYDTFQQSAHHASDLASNELSLLCQRMQTREESMIKERHDLEQHHMMTMNNIIAKHSSDVDEMRNQMNMLQEKFNKREQKLLEDIHDLKESSSSHVGDMESRYKQEQQMLHDKLSHEMSMLQSTLNEVQERYNKTNQELLEQSESYKLYKHKTDMQLSSLQGEVDIKKREYLALEVSCNKYKQQIENLRDEMTAKELLYNTNMSMTSSSMMSDWQKKLDDQIESDRVALLHAVEHAQITAANDVVRIKKLHEDEVLLLKKMLQSEADKTTSESVALEHEKVKLQNILKQEKEQHLHDMNELKARYTEKEKMLHDEKRAALDNQRKELQQLHKQHDTDMMKKYDDEMKVIINNHERAMHDMMSQHQAMLSQTIKDMNEKHMTLSKEVESRLLLQYQVQLQEKGKSYESSRLNQQEVHAREAQELSDDKKRLNQVVDDMTVERSELQRLLQEHHDRYQSSLTAHEHELDTLKQQHNAILSEEHLKHDHHLRDIQDQHTIEVNNMKVERHDEISQLASDTLKLQQAFDMLNQRYKSRESRPEDVQRISSLEHDIIEKDALVARTRDEMLYFKREMLNREENYNQKFNRNPVVGVMQVVKPKDMDNMSVSSKGPISKGKPAALNTSQLKTSASAQQFSSSISPASRR